VNEHLETAFVQTLPLADASDAPAGRPGEADAQAFAQHAEAAFADKAPQEEADFQSLSNRLLREFKQAEQDRQPTEERWLKDIRQYRGKYDPETEAALAKRSKAFVRKTRVKVKTVDSRVADLLFPAGSEKNWTIDTTPVPSLDPAVRQGIEQKLTEQAQGQAPDKKAVDEAVLEVARQAAKGMSKVIEDQLVEARYKQASLMALHSAHLYGTGILKGPLVERKVRTRFVQKGDKWIAQNEEYITPFVEYVPLWRWYPDMADTELEQCQFAYERHIMTKAKILDLARRKSFKKAQIVDYVKANPNGQVVHRTFDQELKSLGERDSKQALENGQYEVLERWGWLDGQDLAGAGVKVPDDRLHETFFSNVWMLPNGTIIKAVLQPLNGVTWPYHMYYFDKDETSIFGEGLAAIMRDDQAMLNASVRMMLDNGAITSGPMIEVMLSLLASTEKAEELAPWKVYLRNSKDPGQPAVRPIEIPNNIEWLQKMAQMFEQNTDETTAIPRYMSGENATTGAAGTARGMSMLMGAANIVIKDLITDWDEGVTRPFLTALYRWNMQFHKDSSIKGDFDVKARGTASLVAREVRAQSLNEFATLTDNPQDAPFIKRHQLLRQRAEALELVDVVKTEDEVKAEQESEEGKRAKEMQQQMQDAQLKVSQGQAAKLLAEAEVAKTKVTEMLANIEKIIADTVATKVETIFAALQAGGVATRDPLTAPAGDEILRSADYKDATPDPSIAQLNGPPVQADQGTQRLMNKGQTFAQEPRGGQPGLDRPQPAGTVHPDAGIPAGPGPAPGATRLPDANTGQRAGIETARIEA
jgi:hypothetical protein